LGQLVQTAVSPSQSLVGNVSGLGGFSIMTPSSINAPGPNISSQLSSSNMLSRLPPQQVLPSVIGKPNPTSIKLNSINLILLKYCFLPIHFIFS